jgi:hypothetical protein
MQKRKSEQRNRKGNIYESCRCWNKYVQVIILRPESGKSVADESYKPIDVMFCMKITQPQSC